MYNIFKTYSDYYLIDLTFEFIIIGKSSANTFVNFEITCITFTFIIEFGLFTFTANFVFPN